MTVADLATSAGLDLDEALVTLWDAGFDELREPRDPIPTIRLADARRALGVARSTDVTSPRYWQSALDMDDDAFGRLLDKAGVRMSPNARRLPKGAVAKLRKATRDLTGEASPPVPSIRSALPMPAAPLVWENVGHSPIRRHLETDEVVGIHQCLVEDFTGSNDPVDPPGIRAANLLESAVNRPRTSLGEVDKYPTIELAGAALLHSLVLNHPFHNGNKRTGLVALLVFLDENGMQFTCGEDDLFKLVLQVAQHRIVARHLDELSDREVLEIAKWIKRNARINERGERVLKWVRLKRILTCYGCTFDYASGVGNRINVRRRVVRRRLLRDREQELFSQVFYSGDGTDVEKNTLGKLRHDLELDDHHGVDSQSFYSMEVLPTQDFIVSYRKTLQRLAKL